MNITVNGKTHNVPDSCTAKTLIDLLNMQNDKIAMEVNRDIVPRSQYAEFSFNENDKIEIVRAIGGGQKHPR